MGGTFTHGSSIIHVTQEGVCVYMVIGKKTLTKERHYAYTQEGPFKFIYTMATYK